VNGNNSIEKEIKRIISLGNKAFCANKIYNAYPHKKYTSKITK